jgi:predicted esterase
MMFRTLLIVAAIGAAQTVCLAQAERGNSNPQMPRPRLQDVTVPAQDVMRLSTELRHVESDSQRAYWIIGPTSRTPRRYFSQAVRDSNKPDPTLPINRAPGLLVVLSADANDYSQRQFWTEIAQTALRGHYYIALPIAPKWSANQPSLWITQGNRAQVSRAKFTTESFVAAIVKDVIEHYAINPAHIFLHGAAESGPAVYASALDETTPFKGFYILASAFRSTQLPPLPRAKNRRFFLQHSHEDKVSPYWMAAAAEKLLADHGATVKLAAYRGGHGYAFEDSGSDRVAEAIAWLEAAK